jgi:cytochrome c553
MKKTLFFWAMLLVAGQTAQAGDPLAGKAKSANCAGCHGVDGISVAPSFPSLAGQHEDYLRHSLKAYQTGKRKNPIMQGQVAGLSDADIADLAAFYARQKGLMVKY